MSNKECGSLPVFTDSDQCVSKWRLTFKERVKVLLFGHVWLGVLSGQTQPPVWMDANKSVFDVARPFAWLFFNLHPSFFRIFSIKFKVYNLFHRVLEDSGRNWGLGILQIGGRHLFYMGVTESEFRLYFLFVMVIPFAHRFTKERAKKAWFWKGQLICRFIGHSHKEKYWCKRCRLTKEEWGK